MEMYSKTKGKDKEIMKFVFRKYEVDKLEL